MPDEPKVWDEDTSSLAHGASVGPAGATYTAAEQGILNAIIAILKSAGLMAKD